MDVQSAIRDFGEPFQQLETPQGTIVLWSAPPFLICRLEGYATKEMGEAMDAFYRAHFPEVDFVIAVNDWANLEGYDSECRKIVQKLNQFMRPKQRETLIHLGPAANLAQKAVRVTAETISKFKNMPIEIFSSDADFDARLRELLTKYPR